jgi:hypothetical protein
MRAVAAAVLFAVILSGCASGPGPGAVTGTDAASSEGSVGVGVPTHRADLNAVDSLGSTPDQALYSYVDAHSAGRWQDAHALFATPKAPLTELAAEWEASDASISDLVIHETRIVEPSKALCRVTYRTVGFSSLEGDDATRTPVVVPEPGEWWVMDLQEGGWKYSPRGPND